MASININEVERINISLKGKAIAIYPELENLNVTPIEEVQVFTHPNSYGYDVVTVQKGISPPYVENEKLIYRSGVSVNEGVLEL